MAYHPRQTPYDEDADRRRVLTPSSLNAQIKDALAPLRNLRVQGEVAQARRSNGHVYFELRDRGSRLRAVIWRSTAARLRSLPREGSEIICHGRLDVWVAGGSYSLVVDGFELAGQGAKWAALQALKEQLASEGLLAAERKRELPWLPRTVGIVTAATGAALRDMLRILDDRMPVRVLLAPAKVQGDGAAESVARGLEALDRHGACDVIIIGRGGGSIDDLWAFNEERVARAVAGCSTPVVSAVGHEVDHLLSDLVADVRAPTPTAAAELVVPRRDDLLEALAATRRRLGSDIGQRLQRAERVHHDATRWLGAQGRALLDGPTRRQDAALGALARQAQRVLKDARRRHVQLRHRLHRAHPMMRLGAQRRRADALAARLRQRGEGRIRRAGEDQRALARRVAPPDRKSVV